MIHAKPLQTPPGDRFGRAVGPGWPRPGLRACARPSRWRGLPV